VTLQWIDDYVDQRRAEGLMDTTATLLHYRLNLFSMWLRRYCRSDIRRLTPAQLRAFAVWLMTKYRSTRGRGKGKNLCRHSVRQTLISICRFLSWLTEEGRLLINPAAGFEIMKPADRLPCDILTRREIKRLLAAPDALTPASIRERAMMELLYGTGIRRQELYNLDVSDLDLSRGVIFVRQGKGRKDRVTPMGRTATEAVARYMSHARLKPATSPVEPALFVNDWGRRVNRNAINRILEKCTRRCNIKRRVTAHMIRHTVATHMLENGANVRVVQEMLGHARLDSTQIYTRVTIPHLRQVHADKHPRGRRRAKALTA